MSRPRLAALAASLGLALAACTPAGHDAAPYAPSPLATRTAPSSAPAGPDGTGQEARAAAPVQAPDVGARGVPAPQVGSPAPALPLPMLEGGLLHLGDLRGRTILLNFWATWCPPCRDEMPALQALYDANREAGLVVLAVNEGEDAATVQEFVRSHGLSYPVVLDADGQIAQAFAVLTLPSSYWVDAHGMLVDRVGGEMSASVMRTKLARALASADAGPAVPRSVRGTGSSEAGARPVATLGGAPLLTNEDVDRRLDLALALERLASGVVLDPGRAADRPEIEARRAYICQRLIDEWLLVGAARTAGLRQDQSLVEAELERLASRAGGTAALAQALTAHGVTIDDLRGVFLRGALAQDYVDNYVLTAETREPPDQAIRSWLQQERGRQQVATTC